MTKCEYCGKEIGLLELFMWIDFENNKAVHNACIKKYMKEHPEKREELANKTEIPYETKGKDEKRINLLENVADINLFISIIVGVIMIFLGFSSGLYLFLGLVLIFEGIIVYALLYVIASMGRNLIAIRKNTEKK